MDILICITALWAIATLVMFYLIYNASRELDKTVNNMLEQFDAINKNFKVG